ncbi:MAG: hypothetical protein O3B22_16460 [Proteobacteria bacterium]|nr:hypothetical protein [Pseudomonadota bacterium]
MASNALISILCADRKALVADIAGHLFDLHLDLGDTTWATRPLPCWAKSRSSPAWPRCPPG